MADKQNLAKKIDLNTKQDILIAGQNITIAADGKTISAANPTSVTVTPVYQAGTLVAAIVVNGNTTNIYAPAQHGDNANQNLALPFNTSQTYEVGDFVIYQENLYQCVTAISTPAAWDSTKWTRALITDVMGQGSGGDYANQNIANTYSTASTYDVGDYVIYDGLLYKCITAVTTPGVWNASYWEHVLVTSEMGSGGGSSVIPNPQDPATDTLTTIGINGTVYDIAGGGSGGSGYTETILWSGSETPSTSGSDINLSGNISDYDMIAIHVGNNSYTGDNIFLVSDLTIGETYISTMYYGESLGAYFTYTSDAQINIKAQGSSYPQTYTKVIGIKYGSGGGGGGSSSEQQILYVASSMTESEINVDMTAYDEYIIFANDIIVSSQMPQGNSFPKTVIQKAITDETSIICYGYSDYACAYSVTANKLTYQSGRTNRIVMIVGIKYGSGGGGGNVDDVYVNGESVLDEDKIAQITSYREVTQAEYDALPASKESDNILYCIKDKATADTTVAPIIYSEEEREVGVWTDGKPLYQKTFYYSTLSPARSDWVLLETLSFSIDTLVKYNVMNQYTEGNKQLGGGYWRISYFNSNNSLYYYTPELGSYIEDVYITIQYTKTTDTPGSGKYAPSGVPAVHYSENEQVVGTWADGSAVYERSIDLGSFSVSSWGDHTIESSINIAIMIDYEGYIIESNILYALPDPSVRIKVDANKNLIFTGTSSWNVASGYLTIRYTKTTS